MKKDLCAILLSLTMLWQITSCVFLPSSRHTSEDFEFLEKGMSYEEVVAVLGEPSDEIVGSSAFTTYLYVLETGEPVYLGFLVEANYLDSAYSHDYGEEEGESIPFIPPSMELPAGVHRTLVLEDFDGITAGMKLYPDIYRQVGPPNIGAIFEGGDVALVFYLQDGGRIAMQTHGGFGCIDEVSYSPVSFGADWVTLSTDSEGICEQE